MPCVALLRSHQRCRCHLFLLLLLQSLRLLVSSSICKRHLGLCHVGLDQAWRFLPLHLLLRQRQPLPRHLQCLSSLDHSVLLDWMRFHLVYQLHRLTPHHHSHRSLFLQLPSCHLPLSPHWTHHELINLSDYLLIKADLLVCQGLRCAGNPQNSDEPTVVFVRVTLTDGLFMKMQVNAITSQMLLSFCTFTQLIVLVGHGVEIAPANGIHTTKLLKQLGSTQTPFAMTPHRRIGS